MTEILIGMLSLGALVALQAGLHHRTQRRFARAWDQVQEDLARNKLDAAEVPLAECIRLVPLWVPARHLFGTVLARQGKLDQAEEQFKMAQSLQPREASGFVELGIFYVTAANRIEDGVQQFKEALRHDPESLRVLQTDPRLAAFRESEAFADLERG